MTTIVRFPKQKEIDDIIPLLHHPTLPVIAVDIPKLIRQYGLTAIKNKTLLVLEIDNEICGLICWDFIWQNRVPLVSWLHIKETHRNQKYTSLLTNKVYDILRQQGYTGLLYGIHETTKNPSTIKPHGYLEMPDKTLENLYWMKLA